MLPGFRPAGTPVGDAAACGLILLTAVISLESHGSGTRYTALAIHADEEGRKKHEEMGFHEGWGTALDQLVAAARKM